MGFGIVSCVMICFLCHRVVIGDYMNNDVEFLLWLTD